MKAIISITNLVVDVENLKDFDLVLRNCTEQQQYDYKDGDYVYYVRPITNDPITVKLLPDDAYEAQKLVYKLKQDQK